MTKQWKAGIRSLQAGYGSMGKGDQRPPQDQRMPGQSAITKRALGVWVWYSASGTNRDS